MITKNIRIQFVDTDASGRIHYSAIFRYFEILDHEFFRQIGYPYKSIIQLGFDIPRVQVSCNYLGNIEYDDELLAQASIKKIGNSSFTFSFQFFKNTVLVAEGTLVNVFINSATGKSVQIPDFIRIQLIEHLEK